MRKFTMFLFLGLAFIFAGTVVQAQTTGSMSGTITDPNGAVVPGATVTVANAQTGASRTATTNSQGYFAVEALAPGPYTVTVEGAGFKRSVARNINVSVNVNAEVSITMEVGLEGEEVTVVAAQETINTTSPTLTNVINTQQVTDLPLPTRNPLDLAALQAGIAVVGNNTRGASVAGLRQSATYVTQDGINVMDNFVKTSSFFAISAPSLNSTAEFSITTGTQGPDAGRGAASVNLVTKGGTNDFHGGLFWMHRNDFLNANSWFNNAAGIERTRQRQHFFGFDIGGPIYFPRFGDSGGPWWWSGKDTAFFFFSYEGFRENFQASRNRTVMTPEAKQGIFRYIGTDGTLQTVNLLNLGNVGVINPITQALLATTPAPNNTDVGDVYNFAGFRYNVSGVDENDKYVGRYDHHLVKDSSLGSHKLEFIYNRAEFSLAPDTFNGLEAPFEGGVNGFQGSTRQMWTGALVSNFGANATNVFRVGRQWAPVGFLLEQSPTAPFVFFSGVTQLYAGGGFMPQGRDTQVWQVRNDFSYATGRHLIRMGADYQQIFADTFNDAGINQSVSLGVSTNNPSGLSLGNLPNATTAILGRANSVYANVVGNLVSSQATFNVENPTSGFVLGATRSRQFKQRDIALYVSDQWRAKNNLTLNFGLRWDFMGVPTIPNGLAIQPQEDGIFGVSGRGNIFNPNAPTGPAPGVAVLDFVSGDTGRPLYRNDWNNFAPFAGFAWSPDFASGPLRALFGPVGKSSIRAGYSISYLRDGFTTISNAMGVGTTNPGLIQTSALTALTGVLSGPIVLPVPTFSIPRTDRDNFVLNPNNGLWAIDQDLRVPYVQQWNAGFEREIARNTAIEFRYQGNHAVKVWRANNFNEVNIFENGFLQEFLNAQNNLAIFRAANPNCGQSGQPACSFRNAGLPGQVNLPTFATLFGSPTSTLFNNTTFLTQLDSNQVGATANTLAFNTAFFTTRNNLPQNFFVMNPNAATATLLTNDSMSNYHALQIMLRRRFSAGLQFQADYTFSKALTNAPAAQGNNQSTLTSWRTLRNKQLDYMRADFDQTHRFIANGVYELPFGRGRTWFSNANGFVDRVIGGWSIGSIVTWSTRPPWAIYSNRATVNQFNAGSNPANLVGMTFQEFVNNHVGIYRRPEGLYFINPDLDPLEVFGPPAPGEFGNFPVASINGPQYFNVDMSITKRIPVTEGLRLELKTTFINLLNHPNFVFGDQIFDSATFGRITAQSGSSRIIHFMGSVRF
jgi:hypothetical protein